MTIRSIAAKPQPYRGQICVLTLAATADAPPLEDTLTAVQDGPASIVLVDCLELDSLPEELCEELARMHANLAADGRELVVVNLPRRAETMLRAARVNTAATKDRPTAAVDHRGPPIADEVAAAIHERDAAVARREWLEADDDDTPGRADRLLAAEDRVAAANDRYLAAVDRLQAAIYLEQSRRDELTGAMQRNAGLDQLRREVDRAHRTSSPLVVAFVDVDHLKVVNDEQGHLAGDAVLEATGRALQFGLRSYDITIRYGGDEFVCVLPQMPLATAAARLSDLQAELKRDGIAITVGLAELDAGETSDDVIDRADRELYVQRAQDRQFIDLDLRTGERQSPRNL